MGKSMRFNIIEDINIIIVRNDEVMTLAFLNVHKGINYHFLVKMYYFLSVQGVFSPILGIILLFQIVSSL